VKYGVGQSVPRKEDPRLVTGGGQFTDDLNFPDQLYLRLLRSPYAHGAVVSVDTTVASEAPGVVAIYTAADLRELGGLPCRAALKDAAGKPAFIPHRPILAETKVCFVGQAVAAVVAHSPEQAQDAVELIEFDVAELSACVNPANALLPDTLPLHDPHDSNLSVHFENGDSEEVSAALAQATHLVEVELINNRVAPSPLEPRACVGLFQDNQYVLYNPSQGAFAQQGVLAKSMFNIDPSRIRVVSLDTGGGFGIRGEVQPEACVCLFAARELGRPVKYTGDRSEMFLSDSHGRDNLTRVTAGFDEQGTILAMRVETTANLGAYCSAVGPFVPTMAGGRIVGTVYRIPHVHHSVRCVFTNTMPVAAYRGAGRPEACYVMERLMEAAAREMGMDAIELRKRNFVSAAEMPYTMPSGVALTSGEFAQTLDLALARADWHGFDDRVVPNREQGMLCGHGLGYYVESSGGGPEEEANITVNEDGSVDVVVGTFSHGQGHRTTYSQILSDVLGIDFDQINIIQGDTEQVKFGGGTGGSRSSQMGGIAVKKACEAVLEDAQDVAADLLQAARETLTYADGEFTTTQNSSTVSLAQVAKAAQQPQFGGRGLSKLLRYDRGGGFTFPNGCHVAEVEIDPETGVIRLLRYSAVDDCGRVINPLLAGGQVHGGVAQGIGQTLLEHAVYDDSGQLITGSLMDYAMPRASHLCDIDVSFNEVLDPNNELGVKGIGEGGACGAPPAVVNAVIDALAPLGITAVDMPLTSQTIWRALRRSRRNASQN
jgi:carbon-monoxide dehydrogenase large subunit